MERPDSTWGATGNAGTRRSSHGSGREKLPNRSGAQDVGRQSMSATASMPTAINANSWRTRYTAAADTDRNLAEEPGGL